MSRRGGAHLGTAPERGCRSRSVPARGLQSHALRLRQPRSGAVSRCARRGDAHMNVLAVLEGRVPHCGKMSL